MSQLTELLSTLLAAGATDEEISAVVATFQNKQAAAAQPVVPDVGPNVGGKALLQQTAQPGDPFSTTAKSGKAYPLPDKLQHADSLETVVGYFQRTSGQESSAGGFMQAADQIAKDAGANVADPHTWPEIVDRFCFPESYVTAEEQAKRDAIAATPAKVGSGTYSLRALTEADKQYLLKLSNVQALNVFDKDTTEQQIDDVINAAGSSGDTPKVDPAGATPAFKALVDAELAKVHVDTK